MNKIFASQSIVKLIFLSTGGKYARMFAGVSVIRTRVWFDGDKFYLWWNGQCLTVNQEKVIVLYISIFLLDNGIKKEVQTVFDAPVSLSKLLL